MAGLFDWWTDTVTVFHRTISNGVSTWAASIYRDCAFMHSKEGQRGGDEPRVGKRTIVRIPAKTATPTVAVGDIVVLGRSNAVINDYVAGQRSTDFLAANPDAFQVTAVHDNTHAGVSLPHVYAEGD